MSEERLEEVCLINDMSYLYLKENVQGFQYVLYDKKRGKGAAKAKEEVL